MQLTILNPYQPNQDFPPLNRALTEPDGLLALGGCLSKQRLLNAYRNGIFPWYNADDPILWWSPDPRLVLFPDRLIVSQSLRKLLRKNRYRVTFDTAFTAVMRACAEPRANSAGTWLNEALIEAYSALHADGYAHSVEAWFDGELVGGLYGVSIGQVFFGESMFHKKTDASKVAFVTLVEQLKNWGYQLVDCQVHSAHLVSLGAETIQRRVFSQLLNSYCSSPVYLSAWQV
jgi:leucyl/phenylalanyl-tRNA--protein transferase